MRQREADGKTFPDPPETFRIKPTRRGRYYVSVCLAKDLPAMKRSMRKSVGHAHHKQLAACIAVRGLTKANRWLCGIVFFAESCIDGGLVAHEMGHAAFRYCERRRIRVTHWAPGKADRQSLSMQAPEEKYCNILEELVRQFWCQFYVLHPELKG